MTLDDNSVGRPTREGKVVDIKLIQMRRENKSRAECAAYFGVTVSAIKAAEKRIKQKISTPAIQDDPAHTDSIDAMRQLVEINSTIIEELKRCNRMIVKEEAKNKIIDELSAELERNPNNIELKQSVAKMIASETKGILAVQDSIIGISSEVRKQIELQLKIAETLYNIQMMQEFQNEVLAIMKEVDPLVHEKLITKLKERRTIRGLVRMSPS
jgi:hypothetical protein